MEHRHSRSSSTTSSVVVRILYSVTILVSPTVVPRIFAMGTGAACALEMASLAQAAARVDSSCTT
jgi:hypothetical protein